MAKEAEVFGVKWGMGAQKLTSKRITLGTVTLFTFSFSILTIFFLQFGSKPSNTTAIQFLGRPTDADRYDANDYHLHAGRNAMVKEFATKLKHLVHSRLQQANGWVRNTFRSRRTQLGRGFGQERTGTSYPFYD